MSRPKLREADRDGTWGVYCERDDRGEWTPLIYDQHTRKDALELARQFMNTGGNYRNVTVVRRDKAPWRLA